MLALALALALATQEADDADRLGEAAASCDLATLREELHRVRLEIAQATRVERQSDLWRQFDLIADAIRRCGTRT